MKTTIDLPEELLHRAKIVAAQRKSTLREIVMQGVDYVINHPAPMPDAENESKATRKRLLAAMKASNTVPMAPLSREEIYAER